MDQSIQLVFLGGLDGIGRNMLAIKYQDEMILIDAGIMFADSDMPGITKIISDFSYLRENRKFIKAIFLTHGHEDHIGALSYLFQEINVPIYGTKLTLHFAMERLRYRGLWRDCDFIEITPREMITIGHFKIEPIAVCHSIPEGVAFCIDTPIGKLIHSGDFRIDETPIDGRVTDLTRFKELGQEGVLLFMSDSTNADVKGSTKSEKEVGKYFLETFQLATGRIIVSAFSSHIHRIQQILDIAHQLSKKVLILGNSMLESIKISVETGHLHIPDNVRITADELSSIPKDRLIIITTGTQGELNSVLSKMAGSHYKKQLIEPGDSVFLSSKPIPGNELYVNRTIDSLFRQGATVYYEDLDCDIHVSGHAFQEELKTLLHLVRPRYFVPIHGDYRHLVAHQKLAVEAQIPESNTFLLDNGDVLELTATSAKVVDKVPAGARLIDGISYVDDENPVILARREIARQGIVSVVLVYDAVRFNLLEPPHFSEIGVVYESEQSLIKEMTEKVIDAFHRVNLLLDSDPKAVEQEISDAVMQYIYIILKRRPLVVPIFIPIQNYGVD